MDSPSSESRCPSKLSQLRILVIDDEDVARRSTLSMLRGLGITKLAEAADGEAALSMIRESRYDIALSDIRMPGLSGIELLSECRGMQTAPAFVFISGYDLFEYARSALMLGAHGYLLKPFDEEELLDVLLTSIKKLPPPQEQRHQGREGSIQQFLDELRPTPLFTGLQDCLVRRETGALLAKIERVYDKFVLMGYSGFVPIAQLHDAILCQLSAAIKTLGIPSEEALGPIEKARRTLLDADTNEQIRAWYQDALAILCASVGQIGKLEGAILSARQHIHANLKSSLSLESVARHVNLSPSYFSQCFKQQTGQTFGSYLLSARIDEAKILLRINRYKALEVGAMVGFSDAKYFYKVFKKATGYPPGKYWTAQKP